MITNGINNNINNIDRVNINTDKNNNTETKNTRNESVNGIPWYRNIRENIEGFNSLLEDVFLKTAVKIKVDEENHHKIVISVYDRKTGEVIKQIPPSRLLDSLYSNSAGLLVNNIV